jgi:hypothetical protein
MPGAEPSGGRSLRRLVATPAAKLEPNQAVPSWAWSGGLASVTHTDAELSIICAAAAMPATVERAEPAERGWRALRVAGHRIGDR